MKKLSTLLFVAAAVAANANAAEVGSVAASGHTMLLMSDGNIYVSGDNTYGQLGDGHFFDSEGGSIHYDANKFKKVEAGAVKFRYVNASVFNSAAIAADGTLYTWGQNAFGQLGQISVGTYGGVYTPTKVDDEKWAMVKGRSSTLLGIHRDGTLYAWGKNLNGQLGVGKTSDEKECAMTPELVSAERWLDCTSGYYHSAAVKADGTLWVWGDNSVNQVNNSTTSTFTTPQQVGEDANWKAVAAGIKMTAALKNDGTLWTWGSNSESALGRKTTGGSDGEPKQVLDKVASFSVGDMHVLAIKEDYTLWGWGYNLHGEMGNGTTTNVAEPTQIGTAQWKSVAAGLYHSMGVQVDGSIWAWGWNRYGQLGLGDDENRKDLVKVDFKPEEDAVAEISAGNAVKVYPTVVEETVSVSADTSINSVCVYNTNGQRLGYKLVGGTSTQLNVSHLSAGTYFVVTDGEMGKSVTRIIKK